MMRSCTALQRRTSRQLRMFDCVQQLGQRCVQSVSTSPAPRHRQLYVDTNINTYISSTSQIFYGRDNVLPVCWQYANVILLLLFARRKYLYPSLT